MSSYLLIYLLLFPLDIIRIVLIHLNWKMPRRLCQSVRQKRRKIGSSGAIFSSFIIHQGREVEILCSTCKRMPPHKSEPYMYMKEVSMVPSSQLVSVSKSVTASTSTSTWIQYQ